MGPEVTGADTSYGINKPMPDIRLNFDEYVVPYTVPPPGKMHALLLVAPPKSGSSLLNDLARDLCVAAGQPFIDIPGYLFDRGFAIETLDLKGASEVFNQPGYCYGGFRHWPDFMSKADPKIHTRTLLMMRDPRDMLVSAYYSVKGSHYVPKAGPTRREVIEQRELASTQSIDDFVLQKASNYREILGKMLPLCRSTPNGPDRIVVRYEDVIFDKYRLAVGLDSLLGLGLSVSVLAASAKKFHALPEKENPDSHIRWVRPGNFRDKLLPETAQILTDWFAPTLEEFGYDLTFTP